MISNEKYLLDSKILEDRSIKLYDSSTKSSFSKVVGVMMDIFQTGKPPSLNVFKNTLVSSEINLINYRVYQNEKFFIFLESLLYYFHFILVEF